MPQTTDDRTRLLIHVRYAAAAVDECLGSLREAVSLARSAGVSWDELATALDTSPRSAEERFPPDDPRVTTPAKS